MGEAIDMDVYRVKKYLEENHPEDDRPVYFYLTNDYVPTYKFTVKQTEEGEEDDR